MLDRIWGILSIKLHLWRFFHAIILSIIPLQNRSVYRCCCCWFTLAFVCIPIRIFLEFWMLKIWQKKVEAEFSRLLKLAERTPGLYFSYDTNLTLRWTVFLHLWNTFRSLFRFWSLCWCYSVQRLNTLGDESKLLPLWRQVSFVVWGLFFFFFFFPFSFLPIPMVINLHVWDVQVSSMSPCDWCVEN